jgi:hypothetical protein
MTYQLPLDPAMQPQAQAPTQAPTIEDAKREQFIALMSGIIPETDRVFGRLPGFQSGGEVQGLVPLGTLEADPLGIIGNLGMPETPRVPLPTFEPLPAQKKIGVPGFGGQFLKEEEVRGTRFPAFAPDLSAARVEDESDREESYSPFGLPPAVGLSLADSPPIQKFVLKAAEVGADKISPFVEEYLLDPLKQAGAGAIQTMENYLYSSPEGGPVPGGYGALPGGPVPGGYGALPGGPVPGGYGTGFGEITGEAAGDAAGEAAGDAATTQQELIRGADSGFTLMPSVPEAIGGVLRIAQMREQGATNAEIIESVGSRYGIKKGVEYLNTYGKIPGAHALPAASIAILAADLIETGKISESAATSAITSAMGSAITNAIMTNAVLAASGTTAAGTFAAAGGTTMAGAGAGATLGAAAAGAIPAALIIAAQMYGAKRDRDRGRQDAEEQAFSAGISAMHPDIISIENSSGHSGKDIIGLFQPAWAGEINHLGQQLNKELGGVFHHGDESVRKHAETALGRIQKYRQKIPAYDSAWRQFRVGNISKGQFMSQSQRALNSYVLDELGGKRKYKSGELFIPGSVGGGHAKIIDVSDRHGAAEYYELTKKTPPGWDIVHTPEGYEFYNIADRQRMIEGEDEYFDAGD